MGNLEDKPGHSPGQLPQEKFRLVQTDRLIEVIRKSAFLLDPQKERLEQLIRSIPENLEPLPANVVGSLIIQRAEERDAAVSQNEYLRRANTELRVENQTLELQALNLRRELSKGEEEEDRKKELEGVFDGSITEKRIFERMLTVYGKFVEDLQHALEDINCKNEDFDGLELLYLVLERLLGIDIEQLSPLEQREIHWTAEDLDYDPDEAHEVDTEPIEQLITGLIKELSKAKEDRQEEPEQWSELPAKPTEEDTI